MVVVVDEREVADAKAGMDGEGEGMERAIGVVREAEHWAGGEDRDRVGIAMPPPKAKASPMQALHCHCHVVEVVIDGSGYAVGLGGPPHAPTVAVATGGVQFRATHAATTGGEAWSRGDAMAEVRWKQLVGDDVFHLVAEPRVGAPLAMGIIIAMMPSMRCTEID